MTVGINTKGNVSLCYKDACVNLTGSKANLVIGVTLVALLVIALAKK